MRPLTCFLLIGAMVLALATLPLLFFFLPLAIACICASLILILLTLPDLVAAETNDTSPSNVPWSASAPR